MSSQPTEKEAQHVQEMNGVPTLPNALRVDLSGTVRSGARAASSPQKRASYTGAG